jgi:hypothetical protein
MDAPRTTWAQRAASSPATLGVPTRRVVHTEDFGPFVVAQLDDATTWAYGAPPRGRFWQWPPGPAALPLTLVRALVAAIEATDDPVRLERWAHWLADGHAADPAAPDLLGWIAKRRRELAAPSCLSPGFHANRCANV